MGGRDTTGAGAGVGNFEAGSFYDAEVGFRPSASCLMKHSCITDLTHGGKSRCSRVVVESYPAPI